MPCCTRAFQLNILSIWDMVILFPLNLLVTLDKIVSGLVGHKSCSGAEKILHSDLLKDPYNGCQDNRQSVYETCTGRFRSPD